MKTYICGNCNARFRTESSQPPRGCPICWSEKITCLSSIMTPQERINYYSGIVNTEYAEIMKQKEEIARRMKKYSRARAALMHYVDNGMIDIDSIPKLRDRRKETE